ncbi:hypothetical protein NDU88_002999 [Pleurodeles waltl]|uniref:Uncharacterized protein n=1 Tax=Pleurodeles waltl TaxID=8319 RepID=A0AAV7LQU0_PLEWA|nr:hypothetical protein NDU88_002999 [Pleurodeles waltl]
MYPGPPAPQKLGPSHHRLPVWRSGSQDCSPPRPDTATDKTQPGGKATPLLASSHLNLALRPPDPSASSRAERRDARQQGALHHLAALQRAGKTSSGSPSRARRQHRCLHRDGKKNSSAKLALDLPLRQEKCRNRP